MKRKSILMSIISLFTLLSLNGCFFDTLQSIMDEKYSEFLGNYPDESVEPIDRENDNSIKLLDLAFNAKENENGISYLEDFSNNDLNYKLDSTKATRIKFNTNTLNLDYCDDLTPSKGNINGLVIPVEFPDARAKHINKLSYPTYQSVSSYYYNTSYGKLNMTFDVLDWQLMSKKSSYYEDSTKYYGDAPGTSAIIHEVLSKIEDSVDLSKYDNDKDGTIDSLYIIYSKPFDSSSEMWWAFQYTIYESTTYDDLQLGYYVFASYDFLFDEGLKCNTATFIHETGHMFGIEDYYDYDRKEGFSKGGLGGADMMDCNIGDHNPFSKFATGWVNEPVLINLKENEETIITIDSFSKNGDCIILADNFNKKDGMFQDYFILSLIDCESKLNKDQLPFTIDGIRVYRVHGELENYTDLVEPYKYYKYDNSYTKYNLLDCINNNRIKQIYSNYEYMELCANNSDLFIKGDKISNLNYYDSILTKSTLGFEILDISNKKATIRIFKN